MKRQGFTLIELMVAMAVTTLLVVLLTSITDSAGKIWQRGDSQVVAYSNARGAMDLLGRELQSALIDLDFGFRVDPIVKEPNNFILRFLRGTGDGQFPIEKVAYQLAWAGTNFLPEVQPEYDTQHPIPVLIRTTNATQLTDIFNVSSAEEVDKWSREWGELTSPLQTGIVQPNDDLVEVAADYVLGWRIIPAQWETGATQISYDISDQNAFYGEYLTSDKSCAGLAFEILVASPRVASRLDTQPEWKLVHELASLFDFPDQPSGTFYQKLFEHMRRFDSTFYLFSKTP